jgi:hypothetical protein
MVSELELVEPLPRIVDEQNLEIYGKDSDKLL